MYFIPDQMMNTVFLSKTGDQIVLMLIYALDKIRCHTCIQGAISLATKNVNIEFLQLLSLDSCLLPPQEQATRE